MKISVYSYVLFGNTYQLPYREMIESVNFADEIIVVTDPRFADGTYEDLIEMQKKYTKLRVFAINADLNNPNIDGVLKQTARSFVSSTSDFLIQMDADEIIHERDVPKILNRLAKLDDRINIVGTSVINFFNSYLKLSSAGWIKERITRNDPKIQHGIPSKYRIRHGNYYRCDSGDGAGYIDTNGKALIADVIWGGSVFDRKAYESEVFVFHYSWYDILRKWNMKTTWHYFWGLLRGRYKNLDDYKFDLDDNAVDFWCPSIRPFNREIKKAIRDEMKEPSIVPCPQYIQHPRCMTNWLSNRIVYLPLDIRIKIWYNYLRKQLPFIRNYLFKQG